MGRGGRGNWICGFERSLLRLEAQAVVRVLVLIKRVIDKWKELEVIEGAYCFNYCP